MSSIPLPCHHEAVRGYGFSSHSSMFLAVCRFAQLPTAFILEFPVDGERMFPGLMYEGLTCIDKREDIIVG